MGIFAFVAVLTDIFLMHASFCFCQVHTLSQRVRVLEEQCRARDLRLRALQGLAPSDSDATTPGGEGVSTRAAHLHSQELEKEVCLHVGCVHRGHVTCGASVWCQVASLHKNMRLMQAELLAKDVNLQRTRRQLFLLDSVRGFEAEDRSQEKT